MPRSRLQLVWDAETDDGTPFGALLKAASEDPEAAAGLALAYAEMPPEARGELIDRIGEDDPNALALLLGVEDDPELSRKLARALQKSAPERAVRRDAAVVWGDSSDGGVVLSRHLHGQLAEALRIWWRDADLGVEPLPHGRVDDVEGLRAQASIPRSAHAVPFERAVDTLTEVVWRLHRRGTPIPEALRPFAEIFSPRRP